MKGFLEGLLPRVFPQMAFQCIAHEGKSDLERSLPRKLRGWREPDVRFVVLRDNDGGDCIALKQRLLGLCDGAGRPDTLIRVVCQELEAWYLGDLAALEAAYGNKVAQFAGRQKYRDPDIFGSPSVEVKRLAPEFQKIDGARRLAQGVDPARSRSRSFRALLEGLARISGIPAQGLTRG